MQKSRQALESKSKLYDRLTKENLDNLEESRELYLVDFERKVLDGEKESRRKKLSEPNVSRDDSVNEIEEEIPSATCPEEEWVEFVDALGRSRQCLRKDLPHYREMDKTLQREPRKTEAPKEVDNWNEKNDLLSDDMKMELERQKWEEDAEAEVQDDTPIGPMHYQTADNHEIRDHGVGYFAFSTEELERKQQLENLQHLREQTANQRTQSHKMKERRKTLLEARLAKVKQRKKIRLGIEDSEPSDSGGESDKETKEEESRENLPVTLEIATVPEKPVKKKKVRPWDLGKVTEPVLKSQQKRKMQTEREWLESRRNERPAEFAPPQYFQNLAASNRSKQRLWLGNRDVPHVTVDTSTSEIGNVGNIPLPDDVR